MDKLSQCRASLEKNNFRCFIAENAEGAGEIIREIFLESSPGTVSYGDSETLRATGILEFCKSTSDFRFIDTFNRHEEHRIQIKRRKEALTCDLFMTGTNAVTLDGKLINLDMIGNRIGGIIFGPRKVIITVGRNKIVDSLDSAFKRVRETAAPKNAARHSDFKTPCVKTGRCMDCSSPKRICNSWSITEKSYPPGRITVILIDDDLGL